MDLLDRLLIVSTSPYSEEEMRTIIGIRVGAFEPGAAQERVLAAKSDTDLSSNQ